MDNGGAIDDDLGIGSNLGGSNGLNGISNNNNNGPINSGGIRPPGQSGGSTSTGGGGTFNPSNGNDPFGANDILQGLDNNDGFSTNPQENAGGGAGGEVVDSSVVPNGGGGQTGPTGSVINGNGGSTNNNGIYLTQNFADHFSSLV